VENGGGEKNRNSHTYLLTYLSPSVDPQKTVRVSLSNVGQTAVDRLLNTLQQISLFFGKNPSFLPKPSISLFFISIPKYLRQAIL
jgi:hypothetical protein